VSNFVRTTSSTRTADAVVVVAVVFVVDVDVSAVDDVDVVDKGVDEDSDIG